MKTTFKILMLFVCNIMLSQTVAIQSFATGLSNPVEIANAGDARLFVVEQGGRIKILNTNGTVNTTPFLNIASLITSGGEQGLLGLAFHPDYPGNGYFYVNYTNTSGNTVIARYTVSSTDANVANASSAQILMTIPQPASNHNGGTLHFGPDGYLYIGMGDGGGAGDTGNRAQNINERLGKMLRIDVNTGSPYGIPADNPYAGATAGADEIWAIGLRNPWKFSFDQSGNLWIADVGQNQIEEINKQPATSAGLNYGWRCYEGNSAYNTAGCAPMSGMTFPLAQYTHSDGCSITGGYYYAGSNFPNFNGYYFFADYCRNRIGRVNSSGTIAYSANFTGSNNFTTFGQDFNGELYIASSAGNIYKVIDSSMSTNDFAVNGFKMYPNPASERIEISSTNNLVLSQFSVVDLAGKILLQQPLENTKQHVIDISSLETGLYVVKLQDAGGKTFTSKLDIK